LLHVLAAGYGTFQPIDQLEPKSADWGKAEALEAGCQRERGLRLGLEYLHYDRNTVQD
jgi:hypothetical protein